MKRRGALKSVYHAVLNLLPDEWAIQILYHRNFGRFADLKTPRTFFEKTNWRKLYQRDPRFTLYADKAAVKAEISALIGPEHVVPTLWSGERPEDIPFDALIPPYVVKVNHGYGNNMFIRRREDLDEAKVRAALARNLRHSHARDTRQWGYYGIPRRIVIEPLLEIFGGDEPEDYKFFVYHGRARFIQINVDRWGKDLFAYYDRDWNKVPIKSSAHVLDRPLAKPPFLGTMIKLAEIIGARFDFVRVDLYHAGGKVYFGETTFYHGAGFSTEMPEVIDLLFGEPWIISPYPRPVD